MRQIVFLKQVPASTEIGIDPVTHTLIRSGSKSQTNPDDLHALQMALEIRDRIGGTIIAVTMGPPQAETVLREALLYGADQGILISDAAFAGSDTWSTGYILSTAVKRIGHADLLLFGKQAIDGDTAQVGPGVAAQLNYPQLTDVREITNLTDNTLTVTKNTDSGRQILRTAFPCVLTVSREANTLKLPTINDWEKAQKKKITHWNCACLGLDQIQLGLNGSPTKVKRTAVPSVSKSIHWVNNLIDLKTICPFLSE